jgi:DNA mismatch endonuclease (patch repair protein)
MVDILGPEARSALMGRIRGRDTKPELAVRRLLYRRGWRYRLHAPDLPGRPDIVFRGRKTAVFVHGCFWHGHSGCALATVPKTRTAFWCEKIEANRARDARAQAALEVKGWAALTVWQCEIDRGHGLIGRIESVLLSRPPPQQKIAAAMESPGTA